MAKDRAELIFVSGPQQGERSLLMAATVIVGRHPSCDIQITEHTVSRQQVRFQLTPHGWVVASIASSPIRINGKRYKAGQQIILDTGDVLGVGLDTEMLFVAQGADVEAALGDMAETHPQFADFGGVAALREPSAKPSASPPPPMPSAMQMPQAAPPPPEPEIEEEMEESLLDEVVAAEQARKTKVRKYAVGFGVYGLLLVGFIAAMQMRPTGEEGTVGGPPVRIPDREIATILTARRPDIPKREIRSPEILEQARRFYDDYPQYPGAMFRAVKHFNIYLAYSGRTEQGFVDEQDGRLYRDAQEKLVTSVIKAYRLAWKHTKNEDWHAALREFLAVQDMLPVNEDPYPDENHKLFTNVRRFIMFIRGKTAKKEDRRF